MLVEEKYFVEQFPPGSSKVISFKLTQGQLNWTHALQLTMESENRSQAIKKMLDVFFAHFDPDFNFPTIINENIECSVIFDLFGNSKYSLIDLGLFLKSLNYDTATCLHNTVMITVKLNPDYLSTLEKLYLSGLVMSRSEAIRFVLKFYIVLLGRLTNNGGESTV